MSKKEVYFRLHFLRIKEHPVFGNLEIPFTQKADTFSDGAAFFTLVIGPNGTGKSRLLRYIIDIFRVAFEKKEKAEKINYPQGKYFLEYRLNGHTYQILNSMPLREAKWETMEKHGELRFFEDAREISPELFTLPTSIIAISNIITDKFLAEPPKPRKPPKEPKPDFFKFYNYMGVRYRGNTAGTRVLIRKTVERIFKGVIKSDFIIRLQKNIRILESTPGTKDSLCTEI